MRRNVLSLCFFGSALLFGCRNSNHTGTGGSGGDDASTTGTKGTSATGTSTGTGAGGAIGCDGDEHTVADITNGSIGPGTKVTLKGVVAMSEKFNVSSSTSCLWGVFVSAPGLTETGPNTGIVALSYGTPPMVPQGGTTAFCPKQGQTPDLDLGDKIPNDVKPGDVLDLVGVTAYFPNTFTNCDPSKGDPLNMVSMRQLGQVCSVTRTGTAPVPAAHLITGADLDKMTSTTDSSFHDQWGGVKVRIENAAVQPTGMPPAVVGMYGNIMIDPGIQIADKAYFRAYQKDACHGGPVYSNPAMTFNSVEGFHYLNFCTWGVAVGDKCGDLDPAPEDCISGTPPMPIASCVGIN